MQAPSLFGLSMLVGFGFWCLFGSSQTGNLSQAAANKVNFSVNTAASAAVLTERSLAPLSLDLLKKTVAKLFGARSETHEGKLGFGSVSSRRILEIAYAYANGLPEKSALPVKPLSEPDTYSEVEPFCFGAVNAVRGYVKSHPIPEASTVLAPQYTRGFLWSYAATRGLTGQPGDSVVLNQVINALPEHSARVLPQIAVFFQQDARSTILDYSALASLAQISDLFGCLLRDNPRFAGEALLWLPSGLASSIIHGKSNEWSMLGSAYLAPLLIPSNSALMELPDEMLKSLFRHHRQAAASWSIQNWSAIPHNRMPIFEASLQESPELAKTLLFAPPTIELENWQAIRKHLACALASADAGLFTKYVAQLPAADQRETWDSTLDLLAMSNFNQAAELILQHAKDESISQDTLNSVIGKLAAHEPDKMAGFLAKLPAESQREAISQAIDVDLSLGRVESTLSLADGLLASPTFSADEFAVDKLLTTLSQHFIESSGDTDQASNWIEKQTSPIVRAKAALKMGEYWASVDPEAAATFLLQQPVSAERDRLVITAAEDMIDTPTRDKIMAALRSQTPLQP